LEVGQRGRRQGQAGEIEGGGGGSHPRIIGVGRQRALLRR